MKKIVLFDMDGTLCLSRQFLDMDLFAPLKTISQYSHIGVVTGSDMEYIQNQLKIFTVPLRNSL